MFCIEKNDKPNIIERKFNLIKIQDNILNVPIIGESTDRQRERLAQKTRKIIEKNSNSRKVILSKEMLNEGIYINYLNTYDIEISDGRWLFEFLATDIIKYIVDKRELDEEKIIISVLINDLTDVEYENIKELAKRYKTINIVTNHIEKFEQLEKRLLNEDGIMITVTNNKKRSLLKSQIILNVDFPTELINKYVINENAIIINIRGKIKIRQKRFNGLNINNYDIDFRDDKKANICLNNNFYLRDIYEAELYKKDSFHKVRERLLIDNVKIKKLYLNNGEI
jgi:hypothetical protein